MRTAQAADRAGINPQTPRYYERRDRLPAPVRSEVGYRSYSADAARIVRFIQRAEQPGFTLAEAEVLEHLAGGGPQSRHAGPAMADEKIAALTAKINDLLPIHTALERMRSTCDRPQVDRDCPLLHALDPEPEQR